MKFRKKPIVIEAFMYGFDCYPDWFVDSAFEYIYEDRLNLPPIGVKIKTLEGDMIAKVGDWVIKGIKGEIYPCDPEIFEMTYEGIDE